MEWNSSGLVPNPGEVAFIEMASVEDMVPGMMLRVVDL